MYPKSVLFMCRECQSSFYSVPQFIQHKEEEHTMEFQNVRCIVFEESTSFPFEQQEDSTSFASQATSNENSDVETYYSHSSQNVFKSNVTNAASSYQCYSNPTNIKIEVEEPPFDTDDPNNGDIVIQEAELQLDENAAISTNLKQYPKTNYVIKHEWQKVADQNSHKAYANPHVKIEYSQLQQNEQSIQRMHFTNKTNSHSSVSPRRDLNYNSNTIAIANHSQHNINSYNNATDGRNNLETTRIASRKILEEKEVSESKACNNAVAAVGVSISQKITSAQKPFVCTIPKCPSRFDTKFSLNQHMISHSKLRPFKCTYLGCHKAFKTKYVLRDHMTLHTGEDRYKCLDKDCDKTFLRIAIMKRHMEQKHGSPPVEGEICSE